MGRRERWTELRWYFDKVTELDDEIDDKISKNKVIFVYCKSGNRSKIAFNTLKNLGYEVYDLGAFTEIDLPKE